MSALFDAERAVAEARAAVHEFLWPLAAPEADRAREAIARLEAAIRRHDAETVRTEGHQWSGEAGRAILHAADLINPEETP